MIDTLIGVVLGAIIASVAPLAILIKDQSRWKHQTRYEYLKSERERLQHLFRKNMQRLSRAIAENSYPSDLITEFLMTMPHNVTAKFKEFMNHPHKTDKICKQAFVHILLAMRAALKEIDDKIEKSVS
jgi:gas vesicle protein